MVTVRRRTLPHWEQPGGVYFVTFRTLDSVPQSVIDDYQTYYDRLVDTYERLHPNERVDIAREVARLYCRIVDRELDKGAGACPFSEAPAANVVADAICHFDGDRYDLFAWCVMPNHVHAVLRCKPGHSLPKVLHSWKSFSATKLNRLRGTEGSLWQREYFDHLVRSQHDLVRFCSYVQANPAKAGLRNYPHTWVSPDVISLKDTLHP